MLTAAVSDGHPVVYQFSIGPAGGPSRVLRDFSPHNAFTWIPMQEGSYTVSVTVKDGFAATDVSTAHLFYEITPLASGSSAVVASLPNPLAALYAAPPCPLGDIVVRFRAVGDSWWTWSNTLPCRAGRTRNFIVAGMRANTEYVMQHHIIRNSGITQSPVLTYSTGSVPASVLLPPVSVPTSPTPESDKRDNLVIHMLSFPPSGIADPLASDLRGRLVWYYDPQQAGLSNMMPTGPDRAVGARV